jgi:hypothetical protein
MKIFVSIVWAILCVTAGIAQNNLPYWQQRVDYKMSVEMDVETWRFHGDQTLTYYNHSPDTLTQVFYHLYFNAFQPGSEMDVRSRTIFDPDSRVADRISKLTPEEIGYLKPLQLVQNGKPVDFHVEGTILVVDLNTPLFPENNTVFTMEWEGQVPLQIRRSGRNNEEGVALSMTQWFPKIAEYDFQGWHADPYISHEFYGPWGDYDVTITLDEQYIIGGTGYLQGAPSAKKKKKTWHFIAPNVHDFTWAADPDYIHDTYPGPNGVILNFYYKNDPEIIEKWKKLPPKTAQLMEYFNEHIGPYPYKQYSVIQGGDGGMEYGMCTLITGRRSFGSLVGVTAHELAHSWFHFLLATNESIHAWMDEGFTSYISDMAENVVMETNETNPTLGRYQSYLYHASSGVEQPQSTHSDRFTTNQGYQVAAYSKGSVFLSQLGYVIGEENLKKTIKRYYKEWAFKHPTPNDFIRVAEKVSGFELDWYLQDWTLTTNTIDYGIKKVSQDNDKTVVTLERIGLMPMPIDLYVIYEDDTKESFYIPLQMMRGEKENPYPALQRTVLEDWAWAYPTYSFEIRNGKKIKAMMIDATQLMADINMENNIYSEN